MLDNHLLILMDYPKILAGVLDIGNVQNMLLVQTVTLDHLARAQHTKKPASLRGKYSKTIQKNLFGTSVLSLLNYIDFAQTVAQIYAKDLKWCFYLLLLLFIYLFFGKNLTNCLCQTT